MLLAEKRKRQLVADKIGHEEYIYKLNGDPMHHPDRVNVRFQGDLDPRRFANHPHVQHRYAGPHRPPYAIDDIDPSNRNNRNNNNNNNYNNNNNNNPAAGAYREQQPLVPAGGYGNYMSPQPVNPSGGGGFNLALAMARPHSAVPNAFAPVSDLPAPLPAIYKPKPPLVFHTGAGGYAAPYYNTPISAPLAIDMSPVRGPTPMPRPQTSPSVQFVQALPPISAPTTPRRQSISNNPILGGNAMGLSPKEEKFMEKMEHRRRAQQLQADNARQIEDKERRKREMRMREISEAHDEEVRLRHERELVARRELAEVEREEQEQQLKMMGPAAAAAAMQQMQERKAAEEAARQAARRGSDHSSVSRGGYNATPPAPSLAPPAPQTQTSLPLLHTPSSIALQPISAAMQPLPAQPYVFPDIRPSQPYMFPDSRPLIPPMAAAAAPPSVPSTYSYEAENLKRELRQISENQMRLEYMMMAEQQRASVTPPRSASPALGAGTYLTSGNTSRSVTPIHGGGQHQAFAPSPVSFVGGFGLNSAQPMNHYSYNNGGAAPSIMRSGGLFMGPGDNSPGRDLTLSSHIVRGDMQQQQQRSPPITVLGSQIHAASSAHSFTEENPDLTMEPSKFVGPVVPPPLIPAPVAKKDNNSSNNNNNNSTSVSIMGANSNPSIIKSTEVVTPISTPTTPPVTLTITTGATTSNANNNNEKPAAVSSVQGDMQPAPTPAPAPMTPPQPDSRPSLAEFDKWKEL